MREESQKTSRRRVLASVVGLTAGAGCSAFSRQSSVSRVHLGLIKLANWSPQQRSVEILVEEDGNVVYWSEFALKSETQRTILSECSNDGLPWEGKGRYIVRAREETSSRYLTVDPVKEARQQSNYIESDRIKVGITFEDSMLSATLWPGEMNCSRTTQALTRALNPMTAESDGHESQ
ncbi:hypothetical protein M0R88_06090 [Halorussus gelatinilyticus]|uniref:Uncharacterized protein n=1 Tax=Halorussus gelatinilyticus TaxID=2937524 RepID=A0A8U0ILM5_9EURY|nr:hypothetical protein [Halorussus gelatinilyticus]UPW01668.1 hypothetical protein M0R88_06090 [Halorussus gelatinilyticus]